MSDQLQSREIDLALAANLAISASDTLKILRSDDTWDQTYKYITEVVIIHDIGVQELRPHRRPQRLDDFVPIESTPSTGLGDYAPKMIYYARLQFTGRNSVMLSL